MSYLLVDVQSAILAMAYIVPLHHGLINYKDTKTKCRPYWCLIEFIDWRDSQSCWYFRHSFVNNCPSNLLSGSPPPLPPSQSQSSVFTDSVWLGRGGGVLSCVEDHILLIDTQGLYDNLIFLRRLAFAWVSFILFRSSRAFVYSVVSWLFDWLDREW